MKYLKIQNKGILPLKLLMLIGASTKSSDLSKIGEFGTGLKYAIAYFIRNQIDIKLFIGIHEVKIGLRENKIKDQTYAEIVINKKPSGITTQYGFQWKAWEAIREIWCNAMDEKNPIKEIVESGKEDVFPGDKEWKPYLRGIKGHTTFYIEQTQEISNVLEEWNNYFINDAEAPLFSDEDFAIYPNHNRKLKLYKNGVLVHTSEWYKSLFRYDVKKCHLNELREYKGYAQGDIATALLNSNKRVISLLLEQYSLKKLEEHNKDFFGMLEVRLDYNCGRNIREEKIKEIFEGYLFLHPDSSTRAQSDKAVKVNKELFDLLKKNHLPIEDIRYSTGGYYGGGSYGNSGYIAEDVAYKNITNQFLKQKIEKFLVKHNAKDVKFSIAVPTKTPFDFMIKEKGVKEYIFNTDLEKLNDKDLEVVIIIMLMDYNKNSTYDTLKRLIKLHLKDRNLNKLIFNKEENVER